MGHHGLIDAGSEITLLLLHIISSSIARGSHLELFLRERLDRAGNHLTTARQLASAREIQSNGSISSATEPSANTRSPDLELALQLQVTQARSRVLHDDRNEHRYSDRGIASPHRHEPVRIRLAPSLVSPT